MSLTGMQVEDGTVTRVETSEKTRAVDYIAIAVGPYASEVAAMAHVDLPLSWYESKLVVLSAAASYRRDEPSAADISSAAHSSPSRTVTSWSPAPITPSTASTAAMEPHGGHPRHVAIP